MQFGAKSTHKAHSPASAYRTADARLAMGEKAQFAMRK